MKVLVADKFEKSGLEGLGDLGCEVLYEPDLKDEALGARLTESGAPILIVRSTKVTRPMIEGSHLRLIIRAGAGYNTIDVNTATLNGITVSNCPGKNANAVAELALGLIIAVDRRIPDNVADLRAGKWNKKEYSKARGLRGATLGLIGFGNIGRAMVGPAQALGMEVIVYGRFIDDEQARAYGITPVTLNHLAERSDIVSVHTSLSDETRGLLGSAFFEALKPGTIFVNTSRAEIVDQTALLDAVANNGLRAGLDVFEGEPAEGQAPYDGVLRNAPGVYCTHHIGASTDQAQEAVAAETVRIVAEFKAGNNPPNAVN